jgi:hypothetical protein
LFGFFDRGVIDGRVFPCRTGGDGEEFVEGEDAGFAAFPALQSMFMSAFSAIVSPSRSSLFLLTLLPLMENRRARMIDTFLLRIGEDLSTTFVDALGRHDDALEIPA